MGQFWFIRNSWKKRPRMRRLETSPRPARAAWGKQQSGNCQPVVCGTSNSTWSSAIFHTLDPTIEMKRCRRPGPCRPSPRRDTFGQPGALPSRPPVTTLADSGNGIPSRRSSDLPWIGQLLPGLAVEVIADRSSSPLVWSCVAGPVNGLPCGKLLLQRGLEGRAG